MNPYLITHRDERGTTGQTRVYARDHSSARTKFYLDTFLHPDHLSIIECEMDVPQAEFELACLVLFKHPSRRAIHILNRCRISEDAIHRAIAKVTA